MFASAMVVYGWTAPAGGPPGNDVEPPINTGGVGQVKQGGLTLGSVAGVQLGLGVLNGNVGIGTITPTSSKGIGGYLDVKDVYLRDVSKWASELGGGGGGGPDFTRIMAVNAGTRYIVPHGLGMIPAHVEIYYCRSTDSTCSQTNFVTQAWRWVVGGYFGVQTGVDATNIYFYTGPSGVYLSPETVDGGAATEANGYYKILVWKNGGGGGGNISCSWVGERGVFGNTGGCNDDLYVTCNGSNVVSVRWGC